MELSLKRKASDILKEDIINGNFNIADYDTQNDVEAYIKKWQSEINGLISNPIYNGITLDMIKRLIKCSDKKKLIETIINDIKTIIRFISMTDNEFNLSVENLQKNISKVSSSVNRKILGATIKKATQIRNKWKHKISINDNEIVYSDIILDVIAEEERLMQEAKKNKTKGGKVGGKVGKACEITDKIKQSSLKKYNLKVGQKFKSADELAKYINKSNTSISIWRKKGWIK